MLKEQWDLSMTNMVNVEIKRAYCFPMCSKETISEKKISKGLDSHLDLRAERTNYLQYQETGVSLYLILYSIYYLYTIVGPL